MLMARVTLELLGGFSARVGAGPALSLGTRKAQALIAYLAVPPGRPHSRDKLASLLWSEAGDWERALAECDAVLRYDPANVEVRLLRVAYRLHRGERERARVEFEEALALHPLQPEAARRWFREKSR